MPWVQSPHTGENINLSEVYRIRCQKSITSDYEEGSFRIELLFFSKEIGSDERYYTKENFVLFYSGPLLEGEQCLEWLNGILDVEVFEPVKAPPIEITIEENLVKEAVGICLDSVKDIGDRMPEGQFANPFLMEIFNDQELVDYLITSSKNTFGRSSIHKSWKLEYEKTRSIGKQLQAVVKCIKELGFAPKMSEYEKDVIRKVIGDSKDENEEN